MKTIKNIFFFFVAFFSIASAQTLFAEPPDTKWEVTPGDTLTITEKVESGTSWVFTLPKNGGALKKSTKGSSTKLNFRTLPDSCKITSTGEAFKNDASIVEVYWPDTVTTIPKHSFLSCSKLTICDFPEGTKITSIGNTAFQSCSNLTRFRMCDTVTSIGQDAFYQCKKMVFDGPMLPNDMTSLTARSISTISGTPLQDGLLVVGGSGNPFTWKPFTGSGYASNHNKYFTGLNITNLIFGAGVANAGTNYDARATTRYNPYQGTTITNIVVQNPGVFTFGDVLTIGTPPTTIRQYDVAGYITGSLKANATTYNTRIVAPKNKYWGEFKKGVTSNDYLPWNEIPDETQAKYWEYFNGGVEGTGDEIPHGVVLSTTSYAITVDGETLDSLTIPASVWLVFKPGEWPEMELTPVEVPVAVEGLKYNCSEQTGVEEGVGYMLTGHKATAAGTYTATATLREGYKWADGSVGEITISWSIDMGVEVR